jgi:flagellar FliL protein
MATATATADAAPAKGKSKLLVILVAVFGLLAAGGGGAAFFFHKKAADSESARDEGGEAKPEKKKKKDAGKPPVFTTLENFTVNLTGEGEHFLQLGVVLQLKDEETAEKVKSYLPQIRNKVLMIASAKNAEELHTPKGKQALIDEILEATRAPLKEDGEDVQAVLLGGMLIQ